MGNSLNFLEYVWEPLGYKEKFDPGKGNIISLAQSGTAKEVANAFIEYCGLEYHESLSIILAVTILQSENVDLKNIQTRRFTKWITYSVVDRMCDELSKFRKELHLSSEIAAKIVVQDSIVIKSESSLVDPYDVVYQNKIIQFRNIPPSFDAFDAE